MGQSAHKIEFRHRYACSVSQELQYGMLNFIYLTLFFVPSVAVACYLVCFCLLRLIGVRERFGESTQAKTRFLVLIPAHNEGRLIERSLRSIRETAYPDSMLEVIVVADNCTDDTATIARHRGVTVWERNDPNKLGKGFALGWAISRVNKEEIDVVVVIDADCQLQSDSLFVLDSAFAKNANVVQLNHRVTNIDSSATAFVAGVGRTLEYDLFFAPKSRCGLFVPLVGTGMAIRTDVLSQFPWNSTGFAEDIEYSAQLAQQGIRVRFASDACVLCDAATNDTELKVQRSRWAAGNQSVGFRQIPRLIKRGFTHRSVLSLDCALSLYVASRPLVFLHAFAAILFSWFVAAQANSSFLDWVLRIQLSLIPMYLAYLAIGVLFVGITKERLRLALSSPSVLAKLAMIAVTSWRYQPNGWVRTPRNLDESR